MTATESLIALAVVLIILGTALSLVRSTHRLLGVQTHTAEIHQRARALFTRFHHDLGNAMVAPGPGVNSGQAVRPAVAPGRLLTRDGRGRPAITVVRTRALNALVLTTATLRPGQPVVTVLAGPSCRASGPACGLDAHQYILISDRRGRSDLLRIAQVTNDAIRVAPLPGRSFDAYSAGASIVPAEVRSYYLDAERDQIRLSDGWTFNAPVLDNVVGLSFQYFGSAVRPDLELTPSGGRCRLGSRSGASGAEAQIELSETILTDGPWCAPHLPFDVDLYRVQRVRVVLRLQASSSAYRGQGRRLFTRPGDATDLKWAVPDATFRFDVTLRNARLWRTVGGPG